MSVWDMDYPARRRVWGKWSYICLVSGWAVSIILGKSFWYSWIDASFSSVGFVGGFVFGSMAGWQGCSWANMPGKWVMGLWGSLLVMNVIVWFFRHFLPEVCFVWLPGFV